MNEHRSMRPLEATGYSCTRAREAKERDLAVAAICKAGGSPESYTIHDLSRACRDLGWNSQFTEGKSKSYLRRQAEEAQAGEESEK